MAKFETSSVSSYDSIQQASPNQKEANPKSHHSGHHHHHHHNHGAEGASMSCPLSNSGSVHHFHQPSVEPDHFGKTRIFPQPVIQRNLKHAPSCHGIRHHPAAQRYRHNVAVATQVINPSAIGGSLKVSGMRTVSSRYEPDSDGDDDDKRGLFGKRTRIHWDTVSCYAVCIGFILLVMTGVVLAVGYMQSERQRVTSAQKLYQQEYRVNATLIPSESASILLLNETESASTNDTAFNDSEQESSVISHAFETTIPTPELSSSVELETKSEAETITEAIPTTESSEATTLLTNVEDKLVKKKDREGRMEDLSEVKYQDFDTSSEGEDKDMEELEIYEPPGVGLESKQESRESEQVISLQTEVLPLIHIHSIPALASFSSSSSPQPQPTEGDGSEDGRNASDKGDGHEWPSQVKVLPPRDFTVQSLVEKELRLPSPADADKQDGIVTNDNDVEENETIDVNKSVAGKQGNSEDKEPKKVLANLLLSPSSFLSSLGSASSFSIPIYNKSSASITPKNDQPSTLNEHFDVKPNPSHNFTTIPTTSFQSLHPSSANQHQQAPSFQIAPLLHQLHNNSAPTPFNLPHPILSQAENDTSQNELISFQLHGKTEANSNTYLQGKEDEGPKSSEKLQTDLFSDDEESPKSRADDGEDDGGESDQDEDEDSEMSASSKMTPPTPVARPIDIMYSPKPGTNPHYPHRSSRLYSAKTNGFYNGGPRKYPSNMSEVRVPPPPSLQATPHSALQAPSTSGRSEGAGSNHRDRDYSRQFSQSKSGPQSSNSDRQQAADSSTSHDNAASSQGTSKSESDSSNLRQTQFELPSSFKSQNSGSGNDNRVTGVTFSEFPPPSTTQSPFTTTHNPYIIDASTTPFDFSQFTTAAPPTGATTTTSSTNFQIPDFNFNHATTIPPQVSDHSNSINTDQLSKRTYNFDFDSGNFGNTPAASTNPFAHLLGNQAAVTGVIGTASSTGANLGYTQKGGTFNGQTYNYDNYNFDNPAVTHLNIPSGTVPIDLASSYIPVNYNPNQNTGGQGSGSYDFSNSYSNTNPTYALASLIQNGAGGGGGGGGQQPDYNTITQGIHLLSLLSGKIPEHFSDTQTSASNFNAVQSQSAGRPEYQIAALTGYGGSSNDFLSNLPSYSGSSVGSAQTLSSTSSSSNTSPFASTNNNVNSFLPVESRSLNIPQSPDLQASNSFRVTPPQILVDQHTSFSQNIVTKAADFSKLFKKAENVEKITGDSATSETKHSPFVTLPQISPPGPAPKSFSISTANQAEAELRRILDLPGAKIEVGTSAFTTQTPAPALRISEKISEHGAQLESPVKAQPLDMDIGASEPLPSSVSLVGREKPAIFSKKLLFKTSRSRAQVLDKVERGLRSGFYVR